jgi:hypothetical protein
MVERLAVVVAEIAQPLQRRDQTRVVALVEADRWLVEDVKHAHERRADLGGQPDPLRLAARQRCGGRAREGGTYPTSGDSSPRLRIVAFSSDFLFS